MKLIPITITFLLVNTLSFSQISEEALQGSWESETEINDKKVTQLWLISGNFYALTEYVTADGDFIATRGGSWQLDGKEMNMTLEF
ncbi:MAG: hypothetical protein AAGI07_12420, partial [Bacteroidota bacterium]